MDKIHKLSIKQPLYNLFLIRHGQSIWNLENKFNGWSQTPLSIEGYKNAYYINKKIQDLNVIPNQIFTSGLKRAIFTSDIIRKDNFNIPIYTSWRLNEKHYGDLEGVSRRYISEIEGKTELHRIRNSYNTRPTTLDQKPNIYNHDYLPYPHYPVSYNDMNKYCICRSKLSPGHPNEGDMNLLIKYNNRLCDDCEVYKDDTYQYVNEKLLSWNCGHNRYITGETNEEVEYRLMHLIHRVLYEKITINMPNTLIISHKHPIRLIMKHFLNIPDDDFTDYNLPKNSIIHIKLDKDKKYIGHEYHSYDHSYDKSI